MNGKKPLDIDRIESIPRLFRFRAEKNADNVAFWNKEFGVWKAYTWEHYYKMVRRCGLSLLELGVNKADKIAILSENRPEWVYTDLGCTCIGGISIGVYPTSSADQLAYILEHSQARFLFVEDEEQLDKGLAIYQQLADFEKIILFDDKGLENFSHPMVIKFDEDFVAIGARREERDQQLFEQSIDEAAPDEVAIIVYTSGTTGAPKGVMLTHENIIWCISNYFHETPLSTKDQHLSCFPLCHILERFLTIYHPLYQGYVVNFVESQEAIPGNLQEVQPTILFAVPRFWEKFHSSIRRYMKEALGIERWIYELAIKVGYGVAHLKLEQQSVSWLKKVLYLLSDLLVFRNIRKVLGVSRVRQAYSGGAPISPELLLYFYAIGMPIRETYGQTECIAVSVHSKNEITPGTVGKPLPELEVKIATDGEILVKGPNVFKGYLNDPDTTAATIVDNWLYTGDVGKIEENGDLRVTERKKDIIITAGGKNITPSEIENQLKFSPYVNDALVIGDRRKYLTALIMIDEDNVMKYAQDQRIPFTTYASLAESSDVNQLIEGEVSKINKKLARVETIKKFRLLSIKLTPEDGEVTPTLKLKRKLVSERFNDLVESMY